MVKSTVAPMKLKNRMQPTGFWYRKATDRTIVTPTTVTGGTAFNILSNMTVVNIDWSSF